MALTPIGVSDNPQQPFAIAESYIPDQLIAGDAKLVTEGQGTVTGTAVLQRGTVMGQTKFGTASASTGKAFATGTIVVAALPTAGDTLTVNGTAITFNANPDLNEVPPGNTRWIQATTAAQAADLCTFLNASTDTNISKMTYTVSSSTITATSKIIGTGGNAYTLATSDSSAFTVSANLSGGTANTGTSSVGSISLGLQAKPGNYTITAASTSSTSVLNIRDPSGAAMPAGVVGTAYVNPEINFTITDNTTTAGDIYVITSNPQSAGVWRICVGTAVDGSENPAGILVDYTDPTAGNVNAGIYLSGEFNGNAMILDPSLSLSAVKAALRPLAIWVKASVSASDPS